MKSRGKAKLAHATQLGGVLALCVARMAHAQLGELMSPPSPPTNLAPAAGVYPTTAASVIPFAPAWSQYFPAGGGIFLNPAATHFVLCFDAFVNGVPPAPCTVATAHYTETIASPSSALTRTGNRFTLNPGRNIAVAERNLPLRLSVGACSSLVQQSCRFISVNIAYSSLNLVARGTGAKTTGNAAFDAANWSLDVRALNEGTSAGPVFSGTVEYWEVLSRGINGRDCLKDVDDPTVRNDNSLVAFDVNGTQTLVPSLPRPGGVYSGPSIQGIYRFGSAYDGRPFTTPNNPSIAAGVTMTSRAVGEVSFPIPPAGGLRTFVVKARLDTGGAVSETNENDNTWAQCKLR